MILNETFLYILQLITLIQTCATIFENPNQSLQIAEPFMDNQFNLNHLTLADLIDSNIISHGFVYYKRDYYFHLDTIFQGDLAGQYIVLFKHCYELNYLTSLDKNVLRKSWSDIYINLKTLQDIGEPDGYPWAAALIAFPGFSVVQDSDKAQAWTNKLGLKMNELVVETDFVLNLVFHSWTLKKIENKTELLNYITYPNE